MKKNRLLIFGNSYIDFVMKVKKIPERGECVISSLGHYIQPGGKGLISALAAVEYGTDVVFSTRIGEDENGEKVLKALKDKNVDTRFIKVDKRKATGVNAIIIEDKTNFSTISYPASNTSMSYDDIESSFMCYPDALLLNFDLKEEFIYDAINFAHSADVPIFLSCGSEIENFDVQEFPPIEVFMPNREAVFSITGIDPIDANSCLHACVKIIGKMKTKCIVIKLGERGVFSFDGVFSEIIPALDVDAVDTNMAGTVFSGALVHSYLNTPDIFAASKFANSAASIFTTVEGTYNSIPSIEKINSFFNNDILEI